MKFERFAKFYNWSNAKKLGAISLLLDGPALAWLHTQNPDTVNNYNNLVEALKSRFGAQNLDFLFRQELYSRKQGPLEPLSLYTADIIKMCQRLSISDKDMMNIFINGLSSEIKNYVILNQPDSFEKAESLARLRDAVIKNTPDMRNSSPFQDQRIKELEGQVNLLMSSMSAKRLPTQALPVQAVGFENFPQSAPVPVATAAASYVSRNELSELRQDMLAVMDARLKQNFKGKGGPNYFPARQGQKGVRGRNLRATDGQPICNKCQRVGHVARYCPESNQSFNKSQNQSFGNGQQHLNGMGPSRWGQ